MKRVCYVVGPILLLSTVIPYPYGLLLDSTVRISVHDSMNEEIRRGTLSVNRESVLIAYPGAFEAGRAPTEHDVEQQLRGVVADKVGRSVAPLGVRVLVATALLGVLLIVIGWRWPKEQSDPVRGVAEP